MTRNQNHGLRKVCDCSRRAWPRCEHSWYLNYRYKKGKHYRISLDKHAEKHLSKSEAQALAGDLRTAIRKGEYPPTTPAPAVVPSDLTFAEFGKTWIEREREDRVGDWKSDKSRHARLSSMTIDGDITLGARPIGRITLDDLETAFRKLEADGLAGQTLNKYLQTCLHLQRWGVRKGYMALPWFDTDNRPVKRVKPAKRARRLEADVFDNKGQLIKAGEERRLLDAANPWMQRLILAALETAMRRGELLKLQWRHVDIARGHVNIPADITKTAEGRKVMISARVRSVLEMVRTSPLTGEDRKPSEHVFGNAAGEKVSDPKKTWETCVLRAHGIKPTWTNGRLSDDARAHLRAIDLTFHDLRHEAGSRWIEAGWPIHHVQQMLGHSDLKQTSTYLNATVKGLEDSMRKYDQARGLLQSVAIGSENAPRPDCNEETPIATQTVVN